MDALDGLAAINRELCCPLCDQTLQDPQTLNCGHTFCRECVIATLEGPGIVKSQCPGCKQPAWKKELKTNHKYSALADAAAQLAALLQQQGNDGDFDDNDGSLDQDTVPEDSDPEPHRLEEQHQQQLEELLLLPEHLHVLEGDPDVGTLAGMADEAEPNDAHHTLQHEQLQQELQALSLPHQQRRGDLPVSPGSGGQRAGRTSDPAAAAAGSPQLQQLQPLMNASADAAVGQGGCCHPAEAGAVAEAAHPSSPLVMLLEREEQKLACTEDTANLLQSRPTDGGMAVGDEHEQQQQQQLQQVHRQQQCPHRGIMGASASSDEQLPCPAYCQFQQLVEQMLISLPRLAASAQHQQQQQRPVQQEQQWLLAAEPAVQKAAGAVAGMQGGLPSSSAQLPQQQQPQQQAVPAIILQSVQQLPAPAGALLQRLQSDIEHIHMLLDQAQGMLVSCNQEAQHGDGPHNTNSKPAAEGRRGCVSASRKRQQQQHHYQHRQQQQQQWGQQQRLIAEASPGAPEADGLQARCCNPPYGPATAAAGNDSDVAGLVVPESETQAPSPQADSPAAAATAAVAAGKAGAPARPAAAVVAAAHGSVARAQVMQADQQPQQQQLVPFDTNQAVPGFPLVADNGVDPGTVAAAGAAAGVVPPACKRQVIRHSATGSGSGGGRRRRVGGSGRSHRTLPAPTAAAQQYDGWFDQLPGSAAEAMNGSCAPIDHEQQETAAGSRQNEQQDCLLLPPCQKQQQQQQQQMQDRQQLEQHQQSQQQPDLPQRQQHQRQHPQHQQQRVSSSQRKRHVRDFVVAEAVAIAGGTTADAGDGSTHDGSQRTSGRALRRRPNPQEKPQERFNGDASLAQGIVGMRVEVWWRDDKVFYPGRITAYNPGSRKHTVHYDDGDVEKGLDMDTEVWRRLSETDEEPAGQQQQQQPEQQQQKSRKPPSQSLQKQQQQQQEEKEVEEKAAAQTVQAAQQQELLRQHASLAEVLRRQGRQLAGPASHKPNAVPRPAAAKKGKSSSKTGRACPIRRASAADSAGSSSSLKGSDATSGGESEYNVEEDAVTEDSGLQGPALPAAAAAAAAGAAGSCWDVDVGSGCSSDREIAAAGCKAGRHARSAEACSSSSEDNAGKFMTARQRNSRVRKRQQQQGGRRHQQQRRTRGVKQQQHRQEQQAAAWQRKRGAAAGGWNIKQQGTSSAKRQRQQRHSGTESGQESADHDVIEDTSQPKPTSMPAGHLSWRQQQLKKQQQQAELEQQLAWQELEQQWGAEWESAAEQLSTQRESRSTPEPTQALAEATPASMQHQQQHQEEQAEDIGLEDEDSEQQESRHQQSDEESMQQESPSRWQSDLLQSSAGVTSTQGEASQQPGSEDDLQPDQQHSLQQQLQPPPPEQQRQQQPTQCEVVGAAAVAAPNPSCYCDLISESSNSSSRGGSRDSSGEAPDSPSPSARCPTPLGGLAAAAAAAQSRQQQGATTASPTFMPPFAAVLARLIGGRGTPAASQPNASSPAAAAGPMRPPLGDVVNTIKPAAGAAAPSEGAAPAGPFAKSKVAPQQDNKQQVQQHAAVSHLPDAAVAQAAAPAVRPMVSFFGFSNEEFLSYKQPLNNLGADIGLKVDTKYTTHLVARMDADGRVAVGGGKSLYLALLRGVPVVGLSWLQASLQEGQLVPPLPYLAKGVVHGAAVYDGGPQRSLSAAQRGQRLFDGLAFVMAQAAEQRHAPRLQALCGLITMGGGLILQLQAGHVAAVADDDAGEKEQLWQQLQQQHLGSSSSAWRRLVVLCGDFSASQAAELAVHWGTNDVVVANYVIDCMAAFRLLAMEEYRMQICPAAAEQE